jgi:hypothetical protein
LICLLVEGWLIRIIESGCECVDVWVSGSGCCGYEEKSGSRGEEVLLSIASVDKERRSYPSQRGPTTTYIINDDGPCSQNPEWIPKACMVLLLQDGRGVQPRQFG